MKSIFVTCGTWWLRSLKMILFREINCCCSSGCRCMTMFFWCMLTWMMMIGNNSNWSFILTMTISCTTDEIRIEKTFGKMLENDACVHEQTNSKKNRTYLYEEICFPPCGIEFFLSNRPNRSISSMIILCKALMKLSREIHFLINIIGESMNPPYIRFRISINQTFKCNCIANRMKRFHHWTINIWRN